jgi:hypothetical protein
MMIRAIACILGVIVFLFTAGSHAVDSSGAQTVIVTAFGVADPEADAYRRDRAIMIEDLREDAKKQCIEKAVGSLVSSETLVENYLLISDRILTQTQGLIKRVISEGQPELGSDGFMRMEMTAEVYLSDIQDALERMSRTERVSLIRDKGNPTISVAITVRNPGRGGPRDEERSPLAENILKEAFSDFGYRVWSDGEAGSGRTADFVVRGEARVAYSESTHSASGIRLPPYMLREWTVVCQDGVTGEQILFNNQVPQRARWSSESLAIEAIGRLIGEQFNQAFFDRHLMRPSTIYELYVHGLDDFSMAERLRSEFLGLRQILNADVRNFNSAGASLFEIDVTGPRNSFQQLLNNVIIAEMNERYGRGYLSIRSMSGQQVEISVNPVQQHVDDQSVPRTADVAEGGTNNGLLIGAAAVILLIVVGGGFVFLKGRKQA